MKRKTMILPVLMVLVLTLFTVSSCAKETTDAGSVGFSDVSKGSWYYDNVMEMAEKGYLKGYPDGTFRPNGTITAAEFVSVVARAGGLEGAAAQTSHWAAKLLQSALNSGWYDWDEIPPTAETYDKPIVRQLAVKVIMKAFAPDVRGDYNTESAKMKDFSQLSGRYYDAVIAAYSKGIVYGDDKGNFNPLSNLTRAEACALISRAMEKLDYSGDPYEEPSGGNDDQIVPEKPGQVDGKASGGISENGKLQVKGTQLCNEKGEAVVLHGMSSHGIQWFSDFLTKECIRSTRDRGANLFRVAMYTGEGGYISNPDKVKSTLVNTVNTALSLDMYAIIDWHILSDGNPQTYKAQSKAFFTEMAKKYKGNPGVIYEICNEPNGNVSWINDVKPYAEEIISAIRAIDPDAVIIVGSPTWSQDLHEAAKSPIKADNIMYTCHFYAGTHTEWLRQRVSDVMKQGLPVFVTEWGTSDASGNGGVYLNEAQKWIDFMNTNKISWANWSLCDKGESSAAVKTGANISDGIQDSELSDSGRFVFARF